ncbi:hypothetical protein BJY04DRAFT_200062 [Aspergillus karnatakaensis]|uniref:F-box protein n=1 Tax=Aspergillus karnatakaensis TaxID=1810916 RepID=UPI003CCCC1EB
MSLARFPAELLLLITSYIQDHKDILSLACSCRAFYPLLLPKVFTSLDLITHRSGHLSLLIHTLASNPDLAREVRSLSVSIWFRRTKNVRFEAAVIGALLKDALGPEEDLSAWELRVQERDNNDAAAILLLSLLPNLENLTLKVHEFSNYTLEWMARVAQQKLPFLRNLKSFTPVCSDLDYGLTSGQFVPIFRLPSLRRFHGYMIFDDGASDAEYDDADNFHTSHHIPNEERFSDITEISLAISGARRGFADLICATKRLESFTFEHGDNPTYPDDDRMCASSFYKPLRRHRKSLQEITITYEGADVYTTYDPYDYDYIGSFKDFASLKKLRLLVSQILNWHYDYDELNKHSRNRLSDIVPSSLETLILDGLRREHLLELPGHIERLVSGGKDRFPNLTYVEIKCNWTHAHQSTEESNARPRPIPAMLEKFAEFKEQIDSMCSAAGVAFCFRDLHIEDIIRRNRSYGFSE